MIQSAPAANNLFSVDDLGRSSGIDGAMAHGDHGQVIVDQLSSLRIVGCSFFEAGSAMDTLAFCILMALNVTFSNVWGIILKEWKGCSRKTIIVLVAGIAVLILSSVLPELLK